MAKIIKTSQERLKVLAAQLCPILCNPMNCSPWNSPGKNTGVVAIPFSRASSRPRDQTWVSCIAGRFFTACEVASVMSDSGRPHRRQPTRLPRPWDSPGKNTGVGCHFLLQCMKVKSESEVAQSCPTLSDPMDCSLLGSSVRGIFQEEYWSRVPLPTAWATRKTEADFNSLCPFCRQKS